MYESKTEPGRKFGSAFRGKRFDSYHGGEQPSGHENNTKSEPANLSGDKGDCAHVLYSHDHENGVHTVTKVYANGEKEASAHNSAKEAYEAGGTEQATDVKKRAHPDQQGAESEERNYEMPDLV